LASLGAEKERRDAFLLSLLKGVKGNCPFSYKKEGSLGSNSKIVRSSIRNSSLYEVLSSLKKGPFENEIVLEERSNLKLSDRWCVRARLEKRLERALFSALAKGNRG